MSSFLPLAPGRSYRLADGREFRTDRYSPTGLTIVGDVVDHQAGTTSRTRFFSIDSGLHLSELPPVVGFWEITTNDIQDYYL